MSNITDAEMSPVSVGIGSNRNSFSPIPDLDNIGSLEMPSTTPFESGMVSNPIDMDYIDLEDEQNKKGDLVSPMSAITGKIKKKAKSQRISLFEEAKNAEFLQNRSFDSSAPNSPRSDDGSAFNTPRVTSNSNTYIKTSNSKKQVLFATITEAHGDGNEDGDDNDELPGMMDLPTQNAKYEMLFQPSVGDHYDDDDDDGVPSMGMNHTNLSPNDDLLSAQNSNHSNQPHFMNDSSAFGNKLQIGVSPISMKNLSHKSLSHLPKHSPTASHSTSQDQVNLITQKLEQLTNEQALMREQLASQATLRTDNTAQFTAQFTSDYNDLSINDLNRDISNINASNNATYDVAVLVSQPLLISAGGSEYLEVDPLNLEDEEKSIIKAFSKSGRRIHYVRKFATVNNLREIVTAGTSIIHYCGHGVRKALLFENENQVGMGQKLGHSQLRKLVYAGKGSANNLHLVFVSACHSEDAGNAFVRAGAKHVVAVRRTAEMHDIAAGTFTNQFYFALVNGKTVQQAFDIANESIKAQFTEDSFIKQEASKFVLLPKKANHNVILFAAHNNSNFMNKSQSSISRNSEEISSNNDFVNLTAKRPMKKFPKPPLNEWVSRFQEIHGLIERILAERLVIISCDKGLGKTAMILRTSHYLWDRCILNGGIFYFDIYKELIQKSSSSISSIVSMQMFGDKMNLNELINCMHDVDKSNKRYLLIFEDIDLFEYEHLASDQRIDTFVEEVMKHCDNIKLLLTLGTPVNQCSFLQKMDKRVMNLKPLNSKESVRLLEIYLSKHFNLNKIHSHIPVTKIAQFCKGFPALIKYAAGQFENDDDLTNVNLRKELREKIADKMDTLQRTRYYKELDWNKGDLTLNGVQMYIRQRDGQRLWEEMYGHQSRGLLNTLLYRMKEHYRTYVGHEKFKQRPLWTYYELEFIQHDLLPYIAKQTKTTFIPPKEVVTKLQTNEIDLGVNNCANKAKKNGIWNKIKKNVKKNNKNIKHSMSGNKAVNIHSLDDDDEKVSSEEKVPIEVFAEFFEYWKHLWKAMMDASICPHYFRNDSELCLIAGMMRKERALTIISQYAKGTFLIRFSKQNPDSLVLVVSTGADLKPSQHKIQIKKNNDKQQSIFFEYKTIRKGVHRSSSLYDLFSNLEFLEHLWYKKRGIDQDYIEKDKRKILKYFKSKKDVFK